jgi:predicted PolB exonuclease-like 3'-5' exonuclease
MSHLPDRQYVEFSSHSESRRLAIYTDLDQNDRAQLWTEHVDRYQREHPDLTTEQQAILARARVLVSDSSMFAGQVTDEMHEQFEQLKSQAIEAFGFEQAKSIIAKLGT